MDISQTMMPTTEMSLITPIFYLVEGFFLIAFNASLLCFLLVSVRTRGQQHYRILAGCVAFDVIFGCAYFSTGVYRMELRFTQKYVSFVSRFYCLNKVHNWLIFFITPEAGILSLFVTLDRAASVFCPVKYLKLPWYYPAVLYTASFMLVIPAYVVSFIQVYRTKDILEATAMCTLGEAIPEDTYEALRWVRVTTTMVAVVLYIPIAYRITKLIKNACKCAQGPAEAQKKRQMTQTIGLITLNQLILFTIPDFCLIFSSSSGLNILFVLNMNKGIVNVIILVITQKDLRGYILDSVGFRKTAVIRALPLTSTRYNHK